MTGPVVAAPTFEHHRSALGIGEAAPRISFKVAAGPGWRQRAYEIEVATDGATTSSGQVDSGESVLVDWPVAPLRSRQRAAVRVRVWGEDEDEDGGRVGPSGWSPWSEVEGGLLAPSDWVAVAVSPGWDEDTDAGVDLPPPLLRRDFDVDAVDVDEVDQARLYVTAHGLYEVEINGARVGDDTLEPGWTSYTSRLRYRTYDVTGLVRPGANAIGAWLGDGWYRGRLGFHGGRRNRYGHQLALLAQLELRLAGGRRMTVATDGSWRAAQGPILRSSLYDGETHDARRHPRGWSSPGFDDRDWSGVRIGERDPATLVAPDGPPVRCTEERRPIATWTTPTGATVLDFGQNLVGRLRVTVGGRAGDQVRLRHAEVVQHGEIYTRPLRAAEATDVYTLAGGGAETWEPRFTFHGFRYAEITGWVGGDITRNVVARVHHTDMARLGHFSCSDEGVNRLHENIVWTMRGNFVEIPMDCPQRDERLGWTGDVQVFTPTGAFLYDCAGMLRSWLRDLAAEQLPDGTVPWYVPYIDTIPLWTPPRPSAVWGDTAVLTPLDLYDAYGDRRLVADQYTSAKAWVDLVDRLAGPAHHWRSGFQLGDWLDPAAPPDDPAAATTDPHLVATAYFARSARSLARMATILDLDDDAAHYERLAGRVTTAFRSHYLREDGRLTSDTQTAYALAICFDLLPDRWHTVAGDRLAQLVTAAGNRIATGFAGTPLIAEALTATGHVDMAYALLLERSCPSWLYAIDHGATTTWERWDSLLPDGRVNPGDMTSFNHLALGAVASWLHRRVAGIEATSPGYRTIRFRPCPGGGLTYAEARHETPYGRAAIRWTIDDTGGLEVTVTVPTGATATVELPGRPPLHVGSGDHRFSARR